MKCPRTCASIFQAAIIAAAITCTGCGSRPGDPPPAIPNDNTETAKSLDALDLALESGDIDGAEKLIAQLQAKGLQHPRLAYIKGKIAELRGDSEGTEKAFLEATALAPRWFEPKAALANHYLQTGRVTSAENLFNDLNNLFPHHPIGEYGLGMVAVNYGKTQAAQEHLLAALKKDSDYPPAILQLALLRHQEKDMVAARQLLGRYLTYVPHNSQAWIKLGEINQSAGRLADARACYQRALDIRHSQLIAARVVELDRKLK